MQVDPKEYFLIECWGAVIVNAAATATQDIDFCNPQVAEARHQWSCHGRRRRRRRFLPLKTLVCLCTLWQITAVAQGFQVQLYDVTLCAGCVLKGKATDGGIMFAFQHYNYGSISTER